MRNILRVTLETVGIIELIGLIRLIITWSLTRSLSRLINQGQRVHWWIVHGKLQATHLTPGPVVANVLFIPGYTDVPETGIGLAHRLLKQGCHVTFLKIGKGGNSACRQDTLTANQERLVELASLAEKNGAPVILIGHSLGGVQAGWLADNLRRAHDCPVKLVIGIQAPVRGSPLGRFGENGGAQELIIDQDGHGCLGVQQTVTMFRDLEKHETILKFFCAIYDEVNPRRFCRLPRNRLSRGSWAETLPHIGHWGALQNPWAMDVIGGFIQHVLRSESWAGDKEED